MANKSQTHFFGLFNDQLEIINTVEQRYPLKYILCGNIERKDFTSKFKMYNSGADIPNLGIAIGTQPATCDRYLVCKQEDELIFEHLQGNYGIDRVLIDQRASPRTIVIQFGGMWNNKAIISGTIGTIHRTEEAQELMHIFRIAIYKYKRVKAYYVGADAYAFFIKGGRLACAAIESPAEFDLQE
jgi:hypothetical protein